MHKTDYNIIICIYKILFSLCLLSSLTATRLNSMAHHALSTQVYYSYVVAS